MGLKSYKNLLKKKLNKEDYKAWTDFLEFIKNGFTENDLEIVFKLHAKYFEHVYLVPCSCGGAKKMETINRWIADINKLYKNGISS